MTLQERLDALQKYHDHLEPFWGDSMHEGFLYGCMDDLDSDEQFEQFTAMLTGAAPSEEFVLFAEKWNATYATYDPED